MKKIAIGTILGILIGIIATETYYNFAAEKTDKLSELIQYKYTNSYLINNGNPEAIKNQLETWLIYLETYEPNKYSTLPTTEAVNIERSAAYYRLALLEAPVNIDTSNDYLSKSIEACAKTSEKAKCTKEMLKIIECVVNISSKENNCKPNK